MDIKVQRACYVLLTALVLGTLADALLRVPSWGLNAAIWTVSFAASLKLLNRRGADVLIGGRRFLLPLAIVLGLLFAWRDSHVLKALDVLALAAVFASVILRPTLDHIWKAYFAHYVRALMDAVEGMVIGPPALVTVDIPLKRFFSGEGEANTTRQRWVKSLGAVGAGALISVPLILVFGGLFASADAAFHAFALDLFDIDWQSLAAHTLTIGFCAWVVAGYCRVLFFRAPVSRVTPAAATAEMEALGLSTTVLAVPLSALNLLFLTFLSIQGRYLFGGESVVHSRTGLTYAEYARQGFFQLVTVAVLALAMLYFADWLDRNNTPRGRRVFRVLASTLVGLVYIVLVSAVYRMQLYQDQYGLTELRVYTMAFMLWLAGVLAWFLATVLRGKRDRFVMGALVSGWAVVIGLHFLNPDARIVKVNLARATPTQPFDVSYATRLSADAFPALLHGIESLQRGQREAANADLKVWLYWDYTLDWRAWSWSRHCARRALAATHVEPKPQPITPQASPGETPKVSGVYNK